MTLASVTSAHHARRQPASAWPLWTLLGSNAVLAAADMLTTWLDFASTGTPSHAWWRLEGNPLTAALIRAFGFPTAVGIGGLAGALACLVAVLAWRLQDLSTAPEAARTSAVVRRLILGSLLVAGVLRLGLVGHNLSLLAGHATLPTVAGAPTPRGTTLGGVAAGATQTATAVLATGTPTQVLPASPTTTAAPGATLTPTSAPTPTVTPTPRPTATPTPAPPSLSITPTTVTPCPGNGQTFTVTYTGSPSPVSLTVTSSRPDRFLVSLDGTTFPQSGQVSGPLSSGTPVTVWVRAQRSDSQTPITVSVTGLSPQNVTADSNGC